MSRAPPGDPERRRVTVQFTSPHWATFSGRAWALPITHSRPGRVGTRGPGTASNARRALALTRRCRVFVTCFFALWFQPFRVKPAAVPPISLIAHCVSSDGHTIPGPAGALAT